MNKKSSSYLDVLSPGYESDTVKEYDPVTEEGQIGKGHEEEVAPANNWESDKRDAVGRAAKKREVARKLRRIARDLEAMDVEMSDDVEEVSEEVEKKVDEKCEMMEDLEDIEEEALEQATGKSPGESYEYDYEYEKSGEKKGRKKKAVHPIRHDISRDNPEADMSSRTGDEWIDIGPGEFDDKRDPSHRAM